MKKYRKTGGGILHVIDKVKKPVGTVLLTACMVTAFSLASQDDLAEARATETVAKDTSHYLEIETINNEWETLGEFKVTAYCSCEKCCGEWAKNRPDGVVYTASGARAEAGKTIAVDTDIIPFGTEVKIGDTIYTAQDTGSAVKGNVIDIYYDSHDDALEHGVKYVKVEVKNV